MSEGLDRNDPPFDTRRAFPYRWGMEVQFTPEQEAQLARIAAHEGMDTTHLVKTAALRLVAEDERFRAAVRRGIAQADRGELIDHDEVVARIERRLRP